MSTFNPFDLLGDEGDTRKRKTTPKPAAPKPAKPATPAAAAKPAAPATTKAAAQQAPKTANAKAAPANNAAPKKENGAAAKPAGGKTEGDKKPRTDRPPRKDGEGRPFPPRGPRKDAEGRPLPPRERAPREDQPQDGSAAAGDKPARKFAKGDRQRAPQRGRQFDRKSGTGRSPTENKKGGSGKANWGNEGEVVEGEVAQEKVETEKEEGAAAAEGEAAKEEAPVEPELKGLDEYLAERASKAVKIDAPKIRQAGEGVDQKQWSEYVPLVKEDLGGEILKKKDTKKEAAAAAATNAGDLLGFYHAPVGDDRRERRERRDRSDRKGGKGFKGEKKGNNNKAAAPAIEFSDKAFPSLAPSAKAEAAPAVKA